MYKLRVFNCSIADKNDDIESKANKWFSENPNIEIVELKTTSSACSRIHCLSVIVLYKERTTEG